MFTPMQDHTISTRHLEPQRSRARLSIRSGLNFRHQLPVLALCAVPAAALLFSAMSQFLFFRELALTSLIIGLTWFIKTQQTDRPQITRESSRNTISSKK